MLYELPRTVWKVTLLHEPQYLLDEDGDEEEEPIPEEDYVEAELDIDTALEAMVNAGDARFIIASEASNWNEAIEDEAIGGDPMTLLVESSDPALVERLKTAFGAVEHPKMVQSYYIDEDDEIIGGRLAR